MRETISNRVMLSDTTDRESSSSFCGQSRDHQKGMGLLVFRFIFIDILVFCVLALYLCVITVQVGYIQNMMLIKSKLQSYIKWFSNFLL